MKDKKKIALFLILSLIFIACSSEDSRNINDVDEQSLATFITCMQDEGLDFNVDIDGKGTTEFRYNPKVTLPWPVAQFDIFTEICFDSFFDYAYPVEALTGITLEVQIDSIINVLAGTPISLEVDANEEIQEDTIIETIVDATTPIIKKVYEQNTDYKIIYDSGEAFTKFYDARYNWVPELTDDSCTLNSEIFSSDISPSAEKNLEIIFEKSFNLINQQDILNLKMLTFGYQDENSLSFKEPRTSSIESYEGLQYLTCLQYLDLTDQNWGRDKRFLSSLKELRFLDLGHVDLPRVEVLYPLEKLEILVLPQAFRELNKLSNIPNLKQITASSSLGCNIDTFNNMMNLETLVLNNSDIQRQENLLNREDSFTISKSPSGEYLELIVPGGPNAFMQDYSDPPVGIHSREYMMNVMQNIYDVVDDNYEVIVFIGNQEDSTVGYAGQAEFISNDEPGLGHPIWSSSSCYGSNETLRGHISIPSLNSLYNVTTEEYASFGYGPLFHEILHLWGGADLIPYFQIHDGIYGGGHWGYSSGGILGGFRNESLKEISDNVYQVDWFGTVGNDLTWNMGNPEKYIMGILPSEEFEEITSFVDLIDFDSLCENYVANWWEGGMTSCIKPGKVLTYTLEDIQNIYGAVKYRESREISTLFVFVSEDKVTEDEWKILDEKISWHTQEANVDDGFQNIYEASSGLIKLLLPSP